MTTQVAVLREDTVPKKAKPIAWQRVGEEAVVLHVEHRMLRGLNLTGWRVWSLVDGTRTLAEIADAMVADYQIQRDRALADVTRFLELLLECALIETSR